MTTAVIARCPCDRTTPGRPYQSGDCRDCWQFYHDAHYRRRRGGEGPVVPVVAKSTSSRRHIAAERPPCRHLGADTGELVQCETCVGTRLKVFECAKHGRCTIAKHGVGVKGCCADGCYEAPQPEAVEASIRSMTPTKHPPGWVDRADVQDAHRRLFHEQLASSPTYPGGFESDGIVIPGGGPYFPSAYVAVRSLRHFGCTLPIQVWHRGPGEPVESDLLREWGAEAVDALAVLPQGRIPGGWEAKLFAAERCRFRRVLVMDADITAFSNVDDWFKLLDSRPIAVTPDHQGQDREVFFDLHGVPRDGGIPINSGVQLIDKSAAWPFLTAARWLNDHSDYYYGARTDGRNILGYGDQDCTRLALAATKTPFHFFGPAPPIRTIGLIQYAGDGRLLLAHRFHGKWHHADWGRPSFTSNVNVRRRDWPHENLVHGWFADFGAATIEKIPGWFDFADLYDRAVARAAVGGALVEVGCWHGRSFKYLLRKAKAANRRLNVVGVDLFRGAKGTEYAADKTVEASCRRNADAAGYPYRLLTVPSVEAAGQFADASLDFVFLDASHDYESVRDDVAAWQPKLKPAGVMAGHDWAPEFPGVAQAVTEALGEVELSGRSWWCDAAGRST